MKLKYYDKHNKIKSLNVDVWSFFKFYIVSYFILTAILVIIGLMFIFIE